MMAELGVIIGGFVALGGFLWLLIGGLKAHIDDSIQLLSEEMAEVILRMSQGGMQGGEPPNPMQQMLMQLIQSRIQTPRGRDGQFTSSLLEKGDK
jgi:hypothetical protein